MVKTNSGVNFFNNTKPSRLCKMSLLARFKQLTSTHSNIPCIVPYNVDEVPSNGDPNAAPVVIEPYKSTYAFLKNSSKHYMDAKIALYSTLEEVGLGTWVKNPVDIDMFDR